MLKKILYEVEVLVTTQYQPQLSQMGHSGHVFSYTIKITNHSNYIIQLLSRKWIIIDSLGHEKVVEGEGVIGKTPIIEPGAEFIYTSATSIESELGKMMGEYIVKDLNSHKEYVVNIPEFDLVVPYKLN